MEQTQNGISDERLTEIVGAGKLWCGDPGMQTMARELTALRARCEAAEKREADLIVSDASMVEALCKYRASHKRLVEALQSCMNNLNMTRLIMPADARTQTAELLAEYRATLADARKLEGK